MEDKIRFAWLRSGSLSGQLSLNQVTEQLKNYIGAEEATSFDQIIRALGASPKDLREDEQRKLLNLLLLHNVIRSWTDIIYIPSSGNRKDGDYEGSGGLILFEKLPNAADAPEDQWFRWTLDRVTYLHSAVQQFYSFFIRQDRERISAFCAAFSSCNYNGQKFFSSPWISCGDLRLQVKNHEDAVKEYLFYLQERQACLQ